MAQSSNQGGGHAHAVRGFEALAAQIRHAGVKAVFGLISDDTAMLIAQLDALGVRYYSARHENMAIAMAEGYASATGGLGVAVIGRGPALANGLHAAVYAQRSGARTLIVFGARSTLGGEDLKEFDGAGVLQVAGLRTVSAASTDSLCSAFAEAASLTHSIGCVALLVPADLLKRPLARAPVFVDVPPAPVPQPAGDAAIEAAAALLREGRRPLIIAGYGAHLAGAREAILQLADRTGAVLATTLRAKDMFRGHPRDAGIIGSFSQRAGRRLMEQADHTIAFGAVLNTRTTGNQTALPAGPVIHVDHEPSHIGRWHRAEVHVVGDARRVAEQLLALVPDRGAAIEPLQGERLADADALAEYQIAHTQRTMDPRALAHALDRLLPVDRHTVYDAGNFIQIEPLVSVPGPACLKNTWDFSSIGLGFGVALGFAAGVPQRPTVFFTGDGGFLMQLGELETCVREGLPLLIVVMNDCAYGAEMHALKERDMPFSTATCADVDFAPVAEAFGFEAHTVRTLEQLQELASRLAAPDGPMLLDCKINGAIPAPFRAEGVAREQAALEQAARERAACA